MSFFDSVKDKVSAIFTTRDLNLDDYAAEPQTGVSLEDLRNISEVINNMETELAFIKTTLKGEQFIRKPRKNPKVRLWLVNNMLLITCVWQLLLLVTVALCELIFTDGNGALYVSITLGSIIQFIQLVFIIVTSVKLGKQLRHRTASSWFLIQSFLSVIILFAGIFTLLYTIDSESFYGTTLHPNERIFPLFTVFLYFSATTITTVGYGDIYPIVWYSQVLVLVEALLSVVYTTVIFAQGLTQLGGKLAIKPSRESAPLN